jgi:MoaA/NifB/PqqE/SkfB family radical SAM enzyme
VPQMAARGMTVRFNTVIKDDNIDEVMPIVRHAASIGAGANLSIYTDFKNGNGAHLIRDDQLARIEALTVELVDFKRAHRGVLSNSDWYIAQIPRYLRGEMREPCRAGETTIHIDPSGHVRRCPDFPADGHWSEHVRYEPVSCNKCYYACRGEAQAPLTLSRFRDLAAKA